MRRAWDHGAIKIKIRDKPMVSGIQFVRPLVSCMEPIGGITSIKSRQEIVLRLYIIVCIRHDIFLSIVGIHLSAT